MDVVGALFGSSLLLALLPCPYGSLSGTMGKERYDGPAEDQEDAVGTGYE